VVIQNYKSVVPKVRSTKPSHLGVRLVTQRWTLAFANATALEKLSGAGISVDLTEAARHIIVVGTCLLLLYVPRYG
jgi:hypothetical protein